MPGHRITKCFLKHGHSDRFCRVNAAFRTPGMPPSGGRNQRNSTFAGNLLTLFREFCF